MKKTIKNIIKNIVAKSGYELRPKSKDDSLIKDLNLYQRLYNEKTLLTKPFYNIGSGDFYHPYWTNLDYVNDWYRDVQKNVVHIDLMEKGPLPIASDSAEVLYTSHTIEHIKDDAVQNLFKEAHRTLKSGGYFRITCPNAEANYAALMRNDPDWFYWDNFYESPGSFEHLYLKPPASAPIEERWLDSVANQLAPHSLSLIPSKTKFHKSEIRELLTKYTREEMLNYLTSLCDFDPQRCSSHINWWDYSKLESFLKNAGFTTIYRSGFSQSGCAILRNTNYFDNTHPQMSIYVEAVKS